MAFNFNKWASGSKNRRKHRTDKRVARNLGKIKVPMPEGSDKMFRSPKLEVLDAYYESRQYDHLLEWNECDNGGNYVPIHKRRPKVIFNLPKLMCQRLTAKLVGDEVFPSLKVEDDPDTTEYLRMVVKASRIKSKIVLPINHYLNSGSVFIRFYVDEGKFVTEHYLSKYCYPELNPSGDLKEMKIRYTYEDKKDLDQQGRPKIKWYQLKLGPLEDVLFDNPDFNPDEEPVFQVVNSVQHNMGFVQGEWMRTSETKGSVDGYSINEDILGFSDCLNYSLSQSDTAVSYNQDPQLVLKNMDQEEMESLVKSATKSWNLGRDGEAAFLESSLNGVQVADELRDKMKLSVSDLSRVVLMDPEKMAANAQSGKALEILHGPMVDLVKELRPMLGQSLQSLVLKMGLANLILIQQGAPSPVTVPPGYKPLSLDISLSWPPVFAMTIEDLQKKVSVAQQATSAFIISEDTATRWVAKDFGVEDIEEERKKIDAQPVRNPFGGF